MAVGVWARTAAAVAGSAAGGEYVGAGGRHAGEDGGGLRGCLAGGVDDLGQADAEGAVMVDADLRVRIAEFFKGEGGETGGGVVGAEGAALNLGEES